MLKKITIMSAFMVAGVSIASAQDQQQQCVTFSDAEKRELVNLLDMATKAGGLAAAQNAMFFVRKLQTGAPKPTKSPKSPDASPVTPQPEPTKPEDK